MPPKIRITKDDIIQSALRIAQTQGIEAINARAIASELHCSTQPIFSNFENMEQLRLAVVSEADSIFFDYAKKEEMCGEFPPYKASGMAYIRFAKEEKELFRLLYMRNRTSETFQVQSPLDDHMETIVQDNTGMEGDSAKLFHLEMWAFVHGIAAMHATGFLNLPWELISQMLTDAYQGLRKRYEGV